MKSRLWAITSLALLFSLVLFAALPAAGVSSVAAQDSSQFPDGKFVVRVYYDLSLIHIFNLTSQQEYEKNHRDLEIKRLTRKAATLGFELVPQLT